MLGCSQVLLISLAESNVLNGHLYVQIAEMYRNQAIAHQKGANAEE